MKTTMTIVAALAALVLVTVATQAEPGRGPGDCDNHPRMGMAMHEGWGDDWGDRDGGPRHRVPGIRAILMIGDEINLTDQQRGKLEAMLPEFQNARIDQQALIEKAQVRLRTLMTADGAREADVLGAIDAVAREEAALKKLHYTHFMQVKSVLTTEQIDQLKELRRERGKLRDQDGTGPRGRRG